MFVMSWLRNEKSLSAMPEKLMAVTFKAFNRLMAPAIR